MRGDKYSGAGMFSATSFDSLNIPDHLKHLLAQLSNHSLAKSTWSSYKTSFKKLGAFSRETGTDISLPLSDETSLAYVAWLLNRGVSATTVDSYISGIRQLHLTAGLTPPLLRTPLISAVLRGKKNLENLNKLNGRSKNRIAITPNLLKQLKLNLKKTSKPAHDKKLLWACCTICFSGALRCGEVLNKKKLQFDPDTSLLNKHIELKTLTIDGKPTEILQLTLRCEKQNKSGTPTICDIYPSKNSICPVNAYKKWQSLKPTHEDFLPAFRLQSGENLTLSTFNRFLKEMFKPLLANEDATISGHSLRTGLATTLGHLGFADADIMKAGRWSSRAYQTYLHLPRTKRMEVARAISRI